MRRNKENQIPALDKFYTSFKTALLARRNRIASLVENTKIKGDYHEALIREFIKEHISPTLKVGHGILFDAEKNQVSGECDVIIYWRNLKPIFEYQDLVIVDPGDVAILAVPTELSLQTIKFIKGGVSGLPRVYRILMVDDDLKGGGHGLVRKAVYPPE